MADSTSDISKMKVVELKKELKSRGLATTGDKSELVSKLQAALAKDANSEGALDSDELDSDEVLEDDDDDKNGVDLINDDLINDVPVTVSSQSDSATNIKPNPTPTIRVLKRKPPPAITSTENINEDKLLSPDEPSPPKVKITAPDDTSAPLKKIILNRVPITAPTTTTEEPKSESSTQPKVLKVTMDPKERLEMRAKRFGTPLVGDAAKEARKARFGTTATNWSSPSTKIHQEKAASLDVLKKRAERFGASVSKTMVDEEYKEKLERRKAKFGVANA